MVNKILVGIVFAMLMSGCSLKNNGSPNTTNQKEGEVSNQSQSGIGKCKQEPVAIEGYGDKGKRLSNCFVEYPGEPSRQDKSYYVLEDICGQFTKEFIQNALGKPILRVLPPEHESLFNCRYYLDDKDNHVLLVFEYLKIDNQKKGQEEMGRRTEVSDKIPMRNMLAWQPNGQLNNIYLVLGDEKFISIDRSSGSGLTSDELINFAANIAKEIKNYK